MRPSNKQRSRNKSGNNQQRRGNMGNIVNRVFESAGPDGKVRGTPQQIIDKYQALARDAQVSGDRVAAENHLQHAEHYTRLLGEAQRQSQEHRQSQDQRQDDRDGRDDRDDRDERGDRDERIDRDEGDERGDRDEGGYRKDAGAERVRAQGGGQRRAPQPQPQHEAGGLTTFGADEPGEHGPVETPEASWQGPGPEPEARARPGQDRPFQVVEGERREDEPAPAAAEEETPPKRTRSRRKKPVTQVAEASAE